MHRIALFFLISLLFSCQNKPQHPIDLINANEKKDIIHSNSLNDVNVVDNTKKEMADTLAFLAQALS